MDLQETEYEGGE